MNAVPYLIQGKNIILVLNSKSYTISKDTHIAYDKIVEALKSEDWGALDDLVEPKKAIISYAEGYISIEGEEVFWKGQPFHGALASRMIGMLQEGFPIGPMVRFMEHLMQNPSKRSVDQLYGFLEKNSLPITEDGYFLAYKRVRSDYLDCHTGMIDNGIGAIVEMERNMVDDNPDSTCSTGLHFCSESYLAHFGSKNDPVMILKINPADVVSIPSDYDGAKGRCMRYEVVAQVNGDPRDAFTSSVNTEYSPSTNRAPWPFDDYAEEDEDDIDDVLDEDFSLPEDGDLDDDDQVYDLVRVYGDWTEFHGLSLAHAREQVQKNIRQKKAMLKIVRAGTDEEVE
jgi:hypothetical protein